MIINGTQFRIYDVTQLLLCCENLDEIENSFPKIEKLLHKQHSYKEFTVKLSEFLNIHKIEQSIQDKIK